MMKITIDTKVVAGTRRGGKDLYLVVRATSKDEPNPARLATEFEEAFEKAVKRCVADNKDQAESGGLALWHENDRIVGFTTDYDFFYSGTLESLKATVQQAVFEGNWVKDLKTNKYKVKKRIFIDGNAD